MARWFPSLAPQVAARSARPVAVQKSERLLAKRLTRALSTAALFERHMR
jgi:hypothetical protein